jgi:DNA-3-methyladenine glycosylase II
LLAAVRRVCALDRDLAAIVRTYGPPPLWGRRPGFATLIRIVIEQQVSLGSARALFGRLRDALGTVTPERLGQLGEGGLRALGFTRQKSAYCHGLSCLIRTGTLDLRRIARADDQAARAALLSLHGIGPWTADIYLLMALRRPDVWPSGDLALAEAVRRIKSLATRPTSHALESLAARWSPWRSVAARILWHYYLSSPRPAPFLPPSR